MLDEGLDDEDLAWRMTGLLVRQTQDVFLPPGKPRRATKLIRAANLPDAARCRRPPNVNVYLAEGDSRLLTPFRFEGEFVPGNGKNGP
jgi:hypothetical protein